MNLTAQAEKINLTFEDIRRMTPLEFEAWFCANQNRLNAAPSTADLIVEQKRSNELLEALLKNIEMAIRIKYG